MTKITPLAILALTIPLAAQLPNSSILPRPDLQLTTTPGMFNGTSGSNLDSGYRMYDVAAPQQDLLDRSGGLVATARLMYAAYADQIGGNVVIQFARSTDGGRSYGAPVTIYTCNTPGGENLDTGDEELDLVCHGDQVYVTFLTNRDDLVTNGQSLYAVGSNDQGQTWSGAERVSTGIGTIHFDVDEHDTVAASTGLHLVYEWDDATNVGGNENFAYARLGFTGGVFGTIVASWDITAHAIGGADVDSPSLDAQDNVVHLAWKDNSDPVMAGQDQVYSVTSFDGGVTFSAPHNHTQFTAPLPWASARQPYAKVSGPYAFTFMEDSRVDQDDVWMDRGDLDLVNGLVNWTVTGIECSNIPTGSGTGTGDLDVDGFLVDVNEGRIAILYRDDRAVAANSNYAHLAADRSFGGDFIAGTASHHQLSTLTATLFDVEINARLICAVWEQCSGDEEGAIALSHDHGLTVEAFQFTTRGDCSTGGFNVDIDDPECAISMNGDYAAIYADERAGTNNTMNHAFVTGGTYPVLADLTLTNGTIELSKIDPTQSPIGIARLMISAAGTLPGHAVLGNDYGYFVGLNNDLWFTLALQSAPSFFRGISTNGDALFTFPGGLPNLTNLLGFPIDIAGGTIAFGPRLFQSYTDPVRM
jgi:hypothetical protein